MIGADYLRRNPHDSPDPPLIRKDGVSLRIAYLRIRRILPP